MFANDALTLTAKSAMKTQVDAENAKKGTKQTRIGVQLQMRHLARTGTTMDSAKTVQMVRVSQDTQTNASLVQLYAENVDKITSVFTVSSDMSSLAMPRPASSARLLNARRVLTERTSAKDVLLAYTLTLRANSANLAILVATLAMDQKMTTVFFAYQVTKHRA